MSNFIEVSPNESINLDNVKFIKKNNASNGGSPMLLVTYTDTTTYPIVFETKEAMCGVYNKIKNNK